VRLAALNLEGDLRSGSRWSRVKVGYSENLGFTLNSWVSHFHLNVTSGTQGCLTMSLRDRVYCMTRSDNVIWLTYAVISFLRSLAR